VCEKNIKDVQF